MDFENTKYHYDLNVLKDHEPNSIIWCAKAAYLACELEQRLDAPAFQNYAMKRLFRVYMAPNSEATVSPMMLQQCEQGGGYQMFLEDFVARNWGNTEIVDHEDAGWSTQLKNNESFRDNFMLGVAEDLAERSEQPMQLVGYLLEED